MDREDLPNSHPARRATLADQLRRNAARHPDRTALVGLLPGDRRVAWSYAELHRDADRLAAHLAAAGVGRGDVVAVAGRNTPHSLVVVYAALRLGAAVTGVNHTFTPDELHYQLEHSGAAALLAEPEVAARVEPLRDRLPDLRVRLLNDAVSGDGPQGWESLTGLLDTMPDGSPGGPPDGGAPEAGQDEDDIALLTYTSGTESRPKGVRLSHRNYLIGTIPGFVEGLGLRGDDVWYYLMPFHTTAGMGSQLTFLALGNTLVLPYAPEVEAAPAQIAAERVTVLSQTPTFYLAIARAAALGAHDLSRLRLCVTYGGTMPLAVFEAFSKFAPDVRWCTFWSQSELAQTPIVGTFGGPQDIPDGDAAWIGRPVSQLEIRIVDAEGRESDEGELLCRSPGVMAGYHRDPERTAAALDGGWLHTGDLVRRAGADIFFVDRRNDVIKSGGMNVSSVEVERTLYKHPDVREVAVVGLPDEYWSEAVTAFVVPASDRHAGADELREFCKERLAGFKVPKAVHFVDSLPKDGQGKTLKRELRASRGS